MTQAHFFSNISLSDYDYDLPAECIAKFPLAERDQSKLLVADALTGRLEHRRFFELPDLLPSKALLICNNTKVISARLHLQKQSGGKVEILCIESAEASPDNAFGLMETDGAVWKCLIGGRVREGMELSKAGLFNGKPIFLSAKILPKTNGETQVRFQWSPQCLPFVAVLETLGQVPLPPYLKRDADESDKVRYQTVYAKQGGSVAAPTAGLHFTDAVFDRLREKSIDIAELTLHVGLGTFKPIESADVADHAMHGERIAVPKDTLNKLLAQLERRKDGGGKMIAVGTTSVRTLETLYWFGVRLAKKDGDARNSNHIMLSQWDSYRLSDGGTLPDASESLKTLVEWAEQRGLSTISGETQLFIAPGYQYALCDGIITNFHQPHSTLILLVATFLGKSLWKKVYDEALQNGYRFLSYGDASLLRRW
ncbi:MAG: hypothetical protein HY22_14415 [[Candidatus Thermochlorobacteriaceae] bacterium GBChlB]|nr:MAG: hypothetical protein HY22_14415 [[Candidatus Thermochlorobacteriaceae] bacterium GBChlB]